MKKNKSVKTTRNYPLKISSKSGVSSSTNKKKKSSQTQSVRKIPGKKQAGSGKSIRNLDKSYETLEEKVLQQKVELKIKNGQLQYGAKLLRQSDEQIHILTKAIESTGDGVFIIDAQKTNYPIVYSNSAFLRMTGYPKNEIVGRNYFSLNGDNADARLVAEIKDTLWQGKNFHGEMLNYKKNGHKYLSQLRLTPVRSVSGDITHYVGIQTDITLMRQRELEITEQREELLHVTRVGKLAEFVSSLAHEISQPLTAILSYAHTAHRMLAKREPKTREILQYIISDDQRAVEVIRRLRSLLKKSEPEMKVLDINAVINETITLISADANIRNCVITVELAKDIPAINGDLVQLQQVLLNLFSNSFDAMENIPEPRRILVRSLRQDQKTILVEVIDSGRGISKGNMSKLFTHFFTSKPDGLGMGLSISRSIIEAHGGHLKAEPNPEGGAKFKFTLPIKEA